MKISFLLAALLIAGIVFATSKSSAAMPKDGDTAPVFVGKDQDGKDFNLADHIGKKKRVVVFLSEGFHGRLHEGSLRTARPHG